MSNKGEFRASLLPRVTGPVWLALAVVAVVVALAIWWIPCGGSNGSPPAAGNANEARSTDPEHAVEDETVLGTSDSLAGAKPTPDAVIADPNCRMVVGQRTASDTALVYLPLGEGAWFAVVNTFGVVFDGALPFAPERPAVGKRPDGTVLAGFSLEDEVQIVHDGSVIYQFDDVWSYNIADDGSSFFVVEPLAGDATRLVVHNLELREEHHFDLGTSITRSNRGLNFDLAYSTDRAEVIVQPSRGAGGAQGDSGTSRFFPTAGGESREVLVEHREGSLQLPKDLSVFATSEVSYHAHQTGARDRNSLLWNIVKVERDFGTDTGPGSRVWTRDLQFLPLFFSMQLSSNGTWLLLSDPISGVEVLDTADGETVFSYPRRRDIRFSFFPRYSNPMVNLEERFHAGFVGDRLFVTRWLEGKPDEGWDVEVYELDPVTKVVRRVREFKLEPGADETEESFAIRTSLDPGAPISCTDHALLDRRLVIRDDRLTYRAADY